MPPAWRTIIAIDSTLNNRIIAAILRSYLPSLFYLGLGIIIILSLSSGEAIAADNDIQGSKTSPPGGMTIEADKIFYEEDSIIASGNVHFKYKNYDLSSGKMVLRKKDKQIIATENVVIFDQQEKNHYYAELADINYENWQGLLLQTRSNIYRDRIQVNATSICKPNDNLVFAQDVIATPCLYCERDNLPLWHATAKEVRIDLNKERIEYKHVSLKLLDHTIFKSPVFFSPTPNASAKSGIMLPTITASRNTGVLVSVPYYFRIADNLDVTVTTGVSSSRPIVSDIQLGHVLQNGGYKLRFNITNNNILDSELGERISLRERNSYAKTREFRTYYSGNGNFSLKKNTEFGFKLDWLIDKTKTYLKKYNIDDDDILTSRVYINIQEKDWYVTPEIIKAEDLRDIISPGNALAFRNIVYGRKPISKNTNVIIYADAASISARFDSLSYADMNFGANNRRISQNGIVSDIYLGFKASGLTYNALLSNKNTASIAPRLKIDLNLPLKWHHWLLQPMVIATATTRPHYRGNLIKRLHEPNLYRLNHSSIRSTLTEPDGSQAMYGVKFQKQIISDELFTTIIGREHQDGRIYSSGSNDNCTMFNSLNYCNSSIDHKVWVDSKKLQIVHDEINLSRSWKKVDLTIDYTFLDTEYYRQDLPESSNHKLITHNHEVGANIWYNIYQKWWVNLNGRTKMGRGDLNHLLINQGAGVRYKHDCLQVDFGMNYNFLKLKDLRPSMTYYLTIGIPGLI